MCGIAGTYQQVDGESAARVMSKTLAHRGPDDEGLYSHTDDRVEVHLAHRRLSIIDLATGQQPLSKQGLTLCYNGELYNYRELRRILTGLGVSFTTSSDTEVVLESWRRWGPDCLAKFRGMFAFALFDQASGSLFLARDHLGIKPLHYIRRGDGVVFSSEVKALVAAFGHELHIEPGALVASILYFWVPESRCSIREVEKLQPGTWAEFRPDGTSRRGTYWDAAEVAATAAAGPPVDLGRDHRSLGGDAPGGRRARRHLLVGWARLEHRLGPGQAGQPGSRGVHDQVPARGPSARGDARRRRVRPPGGAPARHQAARDRDSAGRREPAAAHGRHPRRAHRGPRGDQHPAHMRSGSGRAG